MGCEQSSGVFEARRSYRLVAPVEGQQFLICVAYSYVLRLTCPPRGNTSVLVRIAKEKRVTPNSGSDGDSDGRSQAEEVTSEGRSNTQVKHVQIDTGKTWREGAIRWFPRCGPALHHAALKLFTTCVAHTTFNGDISECLGRFSAAHCCQLPAIQTRGAWIGRDRLDARSCGRHAWP